MVRFQFDFIGTLKNSFALFENNKPFSRIVSNPNIKRKFISFIAACKYLNSAVYWKVETFMGALYNY